MPQAADYLIADSVPVSRTYSPFSISGLAARFVDLATAATAAGQSYFELVLKPATTLVARTVNLTFVLPIEYTDSTTGNVLVKDNFRFKAQWVSPPNATALQRANFEALVRNAIWGTMVRDYVKDGKPVN